MKRELIPEISIVTPSYNYSNYIRECLESVRSQEGVHVEHLIYDAGSTDGTLDIIREFEHVDLVVESDKGMSDAINKGFKAAKGKWVMWLNTDDRLKLGALKRFLEFAGQHEDADVIYGAWDFIDMEGNYMRTMEAFPFQRMMLSHLGCYIASTSTFFRRSTILEEGYFLNDRFRYVMDGEYYNRLAAEGKRFQYNRQIVADFRLHGDNLSQKHLESSEIDGLLDQQLQFAESRSIRRAYGVTLFRNDHLNGVLDCVLFYWFRMVKLYLKMTHRAVK